MSIIKNCLAMAAGALLFATPAIAQPAAEYGVEPWSEAVVSVTEFEPATNLFRHVGGWTLVRSGAVARTELDYLQVDAAGTARFELWCAPEATTGCIRFVQFSGVAQEPIRPGARAWDTGGIYSIMVRSDDVLALYQQAMDLGWWSESLPIRFQFETSDLRNMVLQGPHGINIAVYERISPDFTGFPVGRISEGFNSMRMVKDWNGSRDFMTDVLGFGVLFSGTNEPEDPAYSNFGIPFNYTPEIKRAASAVFPRTGETGRMEPMQMEGFTGRDFSSRAVAPNLGILSVRYPVSDLAGYRAMVTANGAQIAYEAQGVPVLGIGTVDLFAVRTPDGSLTEFYSAPEGDQ